MALVMTRGGMAFSIDAASVLASRMPKARLSTGTACTYLRTGQCWLYRCAVRNGCSRWVIGWAIDERAH
jgi:hypothetical protein